MPSYGRARTNTSPAALVSRATRLLASEEYATYRPSELIAGWRLLKPPWVPPLATLARVVVPLTRSRTNTSGTALVSPATRLLADEMKVTCGRPR